jgi:hypothetical protein
LGGHPYEKEPPVTPKLVSAAGIAALTIATVTVFTGVESASASSVPNRYNCSKSTHKCHQINGTHDSRRKNECRWVSAYYGSGMDSRYCNTSW